MSEGFADLDVTLGGVMVDERPVVVVGGLAGDARQSLPQQSLDRPGPALAGVGGFVDHLHYIFR